MLLFLSPTVFVVLHCAIPIIRFMDYHYEIESWLSRCSPLVVEVGRGSGFHHRLHALFYQYRMKENQIELLLLFQASALDCISLLGKTHNQPLLSAHFVLHEYDGTTAKGAFCNDSAASLSAYLLLRLSTAGRTTMGGD